MLDYRLKAVCIRKANPKEVSVYISEMQVAELILFDDVTYNLEEVIALL